jgi:hypothetical protein
MRVKEVARRGAEQGPRLRGCDPRRRAAADMARHDLAMTLVRPRVTITGDEIRVIETWCIRQSAAKHYP